MRQSRSNLICQHQERRLQFANMVRGPRCATSITAQVEYQKHLEVVRLVQQPFIQRIEQTQSDYQKRFRVLGFEAVVSRACSSLHCYVGGSADLPTKGLSGKIDITAHSIAKTVQHVGIRQGVEETCRQGCRNPNR